MLPKTRGQASVSPKPPRSRSPEKVFDVWGLGGRKRTYGVVKENPERHDVFVTLTRLHPSTDFRDRYRRLLNGDLKAPRVSERAVETSREGKGVEKSVHSLQATASDLAPETRIGQDTVKTQSTVTVTEEQSLSLEVFPDVSPEGKSQARAAYPTPLKAHFQSGFKSSLQPSTDIVGPQTGFELSTLSTEIEKAQSQAASDEGPTVAPSQHRPGLLVLRINSIRRAEVYPPVTTDSATTVTINDYTSGEDNQPLLRGIKRSRTPETPSLTSGATSIQSSPRSSISHRSSPVKRGSPKKRGLGRPSKQSISSTPSTWAPPQKIVTFNTSKLPKDYILDHVTMAPVRDPNDVSNKIKDVIQNLYDVQSHTHGFVPETQELLIDKMAELTQSLSDLQRLTDKNLSPNNPVHDIDLAPEIVDYVDDGRNPDIFTRDFVELVQRGNAVLNGKKQAFRDFSQIYARKLKEGIGGVGRQVDMVMENAGIEMEETEMEKGEEKGKENGEKKE